MQDRGWIEVNGVALRYDHRRGDGPVHVLMHEMGGSLESWDTTVALLPPGAAVLRYDQRGFGLSEKPVGDMTMAQHVADLLALLDALQITAPVVLAGVAVGAGIAMAFTARHPARVGTLLALAPACGVAAERRAGACEMVDRIAAQGMRDAAAGLFDMAFHPALRTDPQRFSQYRSAWLSTEPRSLAGIYRMLATQDLDADVAALGANALLVGGTLDPLRPDAELRRLAALCPQAGLLFARTGHFMQVHSPAFVAFLLRTAASGGPVIAASAADYMAQPGNHAGASGPLR